MMTRSSLLLAAAMSLAACGAPPATESQEVPEPAQQEAVEPQVSVPENWTARGQEPGWLLTINEGAADFTYDYGSQTYSALLPQPTAIEGGFEYADGPGGLAITVLAKVCADSATGVPYPDTVTVSLVGEVYQGCGGEPDALLAEGDWVVSEINGAGVIEGARIFLAFDPAERRVSGRGGCNSYGADYSVGGEGISFGAVTSTEMACPEDIMAQEGRFYAALSGSTQHAFDEMGALVLTGPQGSRIVARR
jgi:heat shock protein HslJ